MAPTQSTAASRLPAPKRREPCLHTLLSNQLRLVMTVDPEHPHRHYITQRNVSHAPVIIFMGGDNWWRFYGGLEERCRFVLDDPDALILEDWRSNYPERDAIPWHHIRRLCVHDERIAR